jgi:hypothetical protein
MTTQYNWIPVVTSFVNKLKKAGFTVNSAWDTEEEIFTDRTSEAVEHVCACDEGSILFEREGWTFNAVIVLGNHPCETVSDWGWNQRCPQRIQNEFEEAWSEWSKSWEDRECPTIEV